MKGNTSRYKELGELGEKAVPLRLLLPLLQLSLLLADDHFLPGLADPPRRLREAFLTFTLLKEHRALQWVVSDGRRVLTWVETLVAELAGLICGIIVLPVAFSGALHHLSP